MPDVGARGGRRYRRGSNHEAAKMTITIYHNPRCGTSRNVLAMLVERGIEPQVVEYLKTPPDAGTLKAIAKAAGEPLRALVRAKEPLHDELGLADADDAVLLAAMLEHPILINRPIVVTPRGAALCRPAEKVLPLLD